MKKVGVITMGSADNFGALLICYALHEKLRSLGFEAVFLTTQRTPSFLERLWLARAVVV